MREAERQTSRTTKELFMKSKFSFQRIIEDTLLTDGRSHRAMSDAEAEIQDNRMRTFPGAGLGGTILSFEELGFEKRDLMVSAGSFAGVPVGTDVNLTGAPLQSGSLYEATGCTVVYGLHGNTRAPGPLFAGEAEALGEGAAATPQDVLIPAQDLTPQRVVFTTTCTDQQLIQGGPPFLDLMKAVQVGGIKRAVDKLMIAALQGATGTAAVLANHAAPTYQTLIDLEKGVLADSAAGRYAFAISPGARAILRTVKTGGATGEPVFPVNESNRLLGHVCGISSQIPDDGTVGSYSGLSTLLYFDASQIVVGWFGAGLSFEVLTNATLAGQGKRLLMTSGFAAVALRDPRAVSICRDALCV
jgi:hypothetical protein